MVTSRLRALGLGGEQQLNKTRLMLHSLASAQHPSASLPAARGVWDLLLGEVPRVTFWPFQWTGLALPCAIHRAGLVLLCAVNSADLALRCGGMVRCAAAVAVVC